MPVWIKTSYRKKINNTCSSLNVPIGYLELGIKHFRQFPKLPSRMFHNSSLQLVLWRQHCKQLEPFSEESLWAMAGVIGSRPGWLVLESHSPDGVSQRPALANNASSSWAVGLLETGYLEQVFLWGSDFIGCTSAGRMVHFTGLQAAVAS